jgi:vancomycin permeability regulator SanA
VAAGLLLVGTNFWVRSEIGDRAYTSTDAVPARTVAIVPGAALRDGRAAGTLTRRLETALQLYRTGRVRAILVSGNDSVASPEVSAMHRWLQERGVPEGAILSDARGFRTRDTMMNAAGEFDVRNAVICTQAPYVSRSLFLARHAGIDAIAVGLPSPVSRSARGIGLESVKTTLAFLESYLRREPSLTTGTGGASTVVAAR